MGPISYGGKCSIIFISYSRGAVGGGRGLVAQVHAARAGEPRHASGLQARHALGRGDDAVAGGHAVGAGGPGGGVEALDAAAAAGSGGGGHPPREVRQAGREAGRHGAAASSDGRARLRWASAHAGSDDDAPQPYQV